MNRSLRGLGLVVAALLVPTSTSPAQNGGNVLGVADYLDLEQVSEPQISPDGTRILYTRRWVDRMEDDWRSDIWIMNADGSRNRFLSKG
jgi:hypothetical protein